MATLTGSTIADSYTQLLAMPSGGGDGTNLVALTDGDAANTFALKLSTGEVNSTGTLTAAGAATLSTSVTLATGATVTGIDNDDLATGSATLLATQGAIKTYVDAQVGASDTLAEVLDNGGTATSSALAGVMSDETGSGSLVFATSPTLVTPALGTPASGVATNLTGTAASLTAGTVTTNANLTGEVTSVGNATTIADDVVDEANLKVSNAPTNGYVLSAQSGDTGGLTWVEESGGNLTEKGDLEVFTTSQTRLAVGDDDYVLTADSSAASGVAWKESAGTSTFYVQRFNGDTATVAFTLSQTPVSENNTQVYISGVYQQKDTYAVSGTTLTFSSAPATGTGNIEVVTVSTSAIGTTTSDLVTFSPDGTGAENRTTQAKLRDVVSVKDFGAVGDGSNDDTAEIQLALDAANAVTFPAGEYKISDKLVLDSDAYISLDSACQITQVTESKEIFYANGKDNIFIQANGAVLYGEGTWSGAWTSNGGHYDIGVSFQNCTRSTIAHPHIQNCGHCGIRVEGGSQIVIMAPVIEGTSPSGGASDGNFQHGIYLMHASTYGILKSVSVLHPDISKTGQGILIEASSDYGTLTGANEEKISIDSPVIHNITGQHGIYAQSRFDCVGAVVQDINYAGIKAQSGNSDYAHRGFNITGFQISEAQEAILLVTGGDGSLNDIRVAGVATNCQRGISINDSVTSVFADIVCYNSTQYGAILQGADLTDIDLHIISNKSARSGVYVSSTDTTGLRLFPTIRDAASDEGTSESGIRIGGNATTNVDIFTATITDVNGSMECGILNELLASVGIHGTTLIDNARVYGMRAGDGSASSAAWRAVPTDLTITNSGTAKHYDLKLLNSPLTVVVDATTVLASNTTLWARTLDDESAYLVSASLVGKLAGSAERRGVVTTCLAYRDGGNCVVQGTHDDVDISSGVGFEGAFSWDDNGTSLRLYVNSGGTDTYDWVARVTVTPVSD